MGLVRTERCTLMDNTTIIALVTAPEALALLLTLAVQAIKRQWPLVTGLYAVALTFAMGVAIAMLAWALDLYPFGATWNRAMLVGIEAGLYASGVYGVLKASTGLRSTNVAEDVTEADRRVAGRTTPSPRIVPPPDGHESNDVEIIRFVLPPVGRPLPPMGRRVFPDYDMAAFGGSYDLWWGGRQYRYPRAIVDAICTNADAQGRARMADLAIYLHESGYTLNPFLEVHMEPGEIAGSNGESSYGIGQIETRQNPSRRPGEQWLGLDGFKRAIAFMNPTWNAAWAHVGGFPGWLGDLYVKQGLYAARAQGSVGWSMDHARPAVGQALLLHEVWRDARQTAPQPQPPPGPDPSAAIDGLTMTATRLDQWAVDAAAISEQAKAMSAGARVIIDRYR